jgi:hypothetical protein
VHPCGFPHPQVDFFDVIEPLDLSLLAFDKIECFEQSTSLSVTDSTFDILLLRQAALGGSQVQFLGDLPQAQSVLAIDTVFPHAVLASDGDFSLIVCLIVITLS